MTKASINIKAMAQGVQTNPIYVKLDYFSQT